MSEAVIIGAVYDKDGRHLDGRHLKVNTNKVSKSQLQNGTVYTDVDIPSGGYKVKAFIFDGFSDIRPIDKAYTKKNK